MDELILRMMRWGRQGYGCSQILLLLGLEMRGEENAGLVRAMAGLAYGCGSGQTTCGALSGACCLLAYLAAGDSDAYRPAEQLPVLLQELTDWFDERVDAVHGGITCEAIVGEAGPAASRQTCGTLVAEAYAKVMEILGGHAMAV
ncbi:MAG: C_GCAxxG_C_C family protein [Desulfatitalea sp.]|nr:C-GCAxxG-C-C family protein [Desulfatitalea sp.]NNJ99011.1 C_GCAxxG_C_C family protein [Desulfatitalea sp.]